MGSAGQGMAHAVKVGEQAGRVHEDLKGLGCGWHAWQTKRCDGLWVGRNLGPVMGESQRP